MVSSIHKYMQKVCQLQIVTRKASLKMLSKSGYVKREESYIPVVADSESASTDFLLTNFF